MKVVLDSNPTVIMVIDSHGNATLNPAVTREQLGRHILTQYQQEQVKEQQTTKEVYYSLGAIAIAVGVIVLINYFLRRKR